MILNNIKNKIMKNKVLKVIFLLFSILSFVLVFSYNSCVFATKKTVKENGGIGESAVGAFMEKSKKNTTNNDTVTTLTTFLGAVRNVFQIVSVAVAIIMLLALAIKYMVSSVEEKAEIKKHATVYVLGAILIFATNGIISIIRAFAKNIG